MICKKCKNENYSRANFCFNCGAELNKNTVISTLNGNTVTASSLPTVGTRYIQSLSMGNGYLQSAAMSIRNSESYTSPEPLKEYTTNARVHPLGNGDWFCPDCGEMNKHNDRSCRGCGKYK